MIYARWNERAASGCTVYNDANGYNGLLMFKVDLRNSDHVVESDANRRSTANGEGLGSRTLLRATVAA